MIGESCKRCAKLEERVDELEKEIVEMRKSAQLERIKLHRQVSI